VLDRDGVVAWVSASGTLGAAVYDPSIDQWQDEQFSSSGNTLVLAQGVVAWRSASGILGAAAYDWTTNSWDDEQFSSSSSNSIPTITDGTVHWTNSNGAQQYGYTAAHQWQSGANTAVQCEYHAVVAGTNADQHVAYLWCLSIGASGYSQECGDGHLITRRWAWKTYSNGGNYTPELTVLNSVSSSTCDAQLDFGGNGVEEQATAAPIDVVVMDGYMRITSGTALGRIEVRDASGRIVTNATTADTNLELPARFASGPYSVSCRAANAPARTKHVVIVR
jgi:hypothetical protein